MKQFRSHALIFGILSVILLCALFGGAASAQVPQKINYQGYLADSGGTPVNGNVQIRFSIYDAASGGNALWSETQNAAVSAGRYSVLLGSITPIALTAEKPYWLGVQVGSDAEMTPRKEMTSAMYALNADRIDGIDGSELVKLDTILPPGKTLHLTSTPGYWGGMTIESPQSPWGSAFAIKSPAGTYTFQLEGSTPGSHHFALKYNNGTVTQNRLSIYPNGNVGIGTENPTHTLSVNGTIRAKEIVVNTGWADFVFEDDYELMPLHEVEQHIKTRKYLPGIPAGQDVEEHGLSVGDMQTKQMQKIEEIMLYLIDLKKENDALRARVSSLETLLAQE